MILTPQSEADLADVVAEAAAAKAPLEIQGGGTRLRLGRPVQAEKTLSTAGLSGITLYEPGAMTLVVKAGTPVAEIEAALEAEGQMLPFEPMDHRTLLGSAGEPTIGGVVACGVSGPRRIQAGACRDAILGMRFVNGAGQVIKSGGRVMKNVTGLDVAKLVCGSYGTLGVIAEIGFKVLPKPQATATLACDGLEPDAAVAALSRAMGSPFGTTGAAVDGQGAFVRIEGLTGSVTYRRGQLQALLGADWQGLDEEIATQRWRAVRDVAALSGEGAVWRLSLKPSDGTQVVAAISAQLDSQAIYDWAGGLVWLRVPEEGDAGAGVIRAEIARYGGHATLIRAADPVRAAVDVFQPQSDPVRAIAQGLRAKFDPAGVLNPGRMG